MCDDACTRYRYTIVYLQQGTECARKYRQTLTTCGRFLLCTFGHLKELRSWPHACMVPGTYIFTLFNLRLTAGEKHRVRKVCSYANFRTYTLLVEKTRTQHILHRLAHTWYCIIHTTLECKDLWGINTNTKRPLEHLLAHRVVYTAV